MGKRLTKAAYSIRWLKSVSLPPSSFMADSQQRQPPTSVNFINAYDDVDYSNSSTDVWTLIGGTLGTAFMGQNSCAARVSYALNSAGFTIESAPQFQTNLNSDGKRYIVSATTCRGI